MKRTIVSGFFNPLHGGHVDIIEAAKKMGDYLIVLINNDAQQIEKKGKIILDEQNRARLIGALRDVDEVIIGIDPAGGHWPSTKTLEMVANKYPDDELIFCNGGDDRSNANELPGPEVELCREKGIKMVFGVGGDTKADSSSRINQALGHED
ncbi:adenylyltransferase/cytidyltransferase family protein [Candidatus Saccharibacteria bacterium]|nr:adenylyltransferase/cytidyltransferase family protein [Candidatus Saccharibacteria bacterium]